MKKFFLALCGLLVLTSEMASGQTIRRVNNTGGVTGANIYPTLIAAYNAAVAGDIIQLEPSTVSYGSLLSCTKNLRIVGPGYFLGANQPPPLQASTQTAIIDDISFLTTSTGSSIAGVTINELYINTNGITVQRNFIDYVYIGYTALANNSIIRQNYVRAIFSYANAGLSTINNNIVREYVSLEDGSGDFTNNVVVNYYQQNRFDSYVVRNNFFANINQTVVFTANTSFAYNLFEYPTLPTLGAAGPGNVANVAAVDVFVLGPGGSTANFDGWYVLKPNAPGYINPARGTGRIGNPATPTDIGVFGGNATEAYRLSGIPAIPSIYSIDQVPVGNNLNVTVGTRSNN